MTPPFDTSLWSHLTPREQTTLAARLQSADVMIREAIDREGRHHRTPLIQFRVGPERMTDCLDRARQRSLRHWRKTESLIGLIGLCLIVGAIFLIDDAMIALGLSLSLGAAAVASIWITRGRAAARLGEGERAALIEDCTRVAVFDAEALHLYAMPATDDEIVVRRWDLDSLGTVSFGWPGLPGLYLSNAVRKTSLPLTVCLDGAGEHAVPVSQADAILFGLLSDRYAGTTHPEDGMAQRPDASLILTTET